MAAEDGASKNVVGITITARRPYSARCLDVFFPFSSTDGSRKSDTESGRNMIDRESIENKDEV